MKIRRDFIVGITTVCCVPLLASCGGTEPAQEAAASAASSTPAAAPVGQGVADADWPTYNRTLAGDRFSPLAEIDRGNVAQLRVACTYVLPEVSAMQAGPIVVAGTMYFTTERNSYSIDAATCAEKWRVERQSSRPSPLGVQRGFAYLDGRLFRGTSDAHVLALDAATGRLLGYNQLVKRDAHDWDVNAPPVLATTRGGKRIVASANKDGLLSVLDRSALASAADLGARLPTLFQSPTTTRENVDVPLSRTERVRFCPGIQGGNEWNGPAFHPGLNTLYTGAVDWCANVQLAQEVTVPSAGAIWFGSAIGDIQEPPDTAKGWFTAFDADTGAIRWKFAAAPVVAGVTPTAGGLVFTADLTGRFRAFDADSGAVLYELDTGQSIGGGIVSYSAAGKQRIGVASGMKSGIWPGAATESRIQVFALP
ncbi:MAG TPA: PQQ-binding-like beta-propeller repeat protein [Gammaproteobacteria bacterium]